MIYNYFKTIAASALVCLAVSVKAQTPAYQENFGAANNTAFPATWTSNTGDWIIDPDAANGGGAPDCTIPLSSVAAKMVGVDGSTGIVERSISSSFSTIGFTGMTLSWNGYRTTGAPALTVELATSSGGPWTALVFTDVTADNAWHALTPIAVPVAFENQNTVFIRWSYTSLGMNAFMAFDDIDVSGSASPIFYWDGVGALNAFGSWWTNTNATGSNPASFTFNNQNFNLVPNNAGATAATLSGAWTLGGTSTKLNVGDGVSAFNLTLNAVLTMTTGAKTALLNNSTLTLLNTTALNPLNFVINVGSTVDFAQTSVVSLWNTTFSNLTLSGGADKTQSGSPIVNGVLNLNATNLSMGTGGSFQNITLNGTITGSGTFKTTGATSSKLTIAGSGAFGTLNFSGTKTLNQFNVNRSSNGLVTLGTDLICAGAANLQNGNIDLNGQSLTLGSGVAGTVTFPSTTANGLFIGSQTSVLTIGSSGALTNSILFDQSSASTRAMKNLILNRTGGVTLTLGNALEIWGDLTPTAGTFASGSLLTLKSDASHKGRIGQIGASGAFTGSPTVELYKSSGLTGWTNLCSSGVNGNSISNWNSTFAITCSVSCPDGSSVGGSPFTSMYTYDQSTFTGDETDASHYIDIGGSGGTGQALNSKTGYWVYLGNGFPTTTSMIIPLTGGVNTNASSGAINLTAVAVSPNDGWNLIANPYPSPIAVSNILTAIGATSLNIDNTAFYAYDPDANANVALTPGSIIPMGQAFSVRALAASVNLTPSEAWKTAANDNTEIFKTSSASTYYWNDFLLELSSSTVTNPFRAQAYFTFGPGYSTTGFDNGGDSYFLSNTVDVEAPQMFSKTGTQKFFRNALPPISGTVIIPITVLTGTSNVGVYSINPVNISKLPAGACVNLYDIANNITHNLRTGAYTTTIAANASTNQFELRITLNASTLTSNINNPLCSKINSGSIVAKGTTTGPWNYTWKDASNTIVRVKNNCATADTLKSIGVGTYKVDVNTVATCDNANATFNVISTAALPVSNFGVNKDSLFVSGGTPFVFTNSSSNANTYTWLFGDGNSVNTPNASYMYTNAGDYTVKLIAINAACGDSSTKSYNVHALGTPTTIGIANIAANDNNIKIGKDGNGIYVQLNYDKSTKATVSISNLLGQVLLAPRVIEGTNERFYFDPNVREQLLLITVSTNEKRITQRIFTE